EGPCVVVAEVVKEDNVFPMIPAGAPLSGMIIEKPKEQMAKPNSYGLLGIRERVFHWGGEVKITGKKAKGTTVSVRIPYENRGEAP
ncbi:MAG: hypothetical protein RQ767_05760, partial [Thermovirgaceae bacterium]|nr:hypothetical protein [Thermovirgaceae bacterium]